MAKTFGTDKLTGKLCLGCLGVKLKEDTCS